MTDQIKHKSPEKFVSRDDMLRAHGQIKLQPISAELKSRILDWAAKGDELAWSERADALNAVVEYAADQVRAAVLEERREIPPMLFDGYYVWEEGLTEDAKKRTSPENVADVLDAVVRLLRSGK